MPSNRFSPIISDPAFYVVHSYIAINTELVNLPPPHDKWIYVLRFSEKEIADPTSDPLVVFYDAGIKKFIWRDVLWAHHWLADRDLMRHIDKAMKVASIDARDQLRRWHDYLWCDPISAGISQVIYKIR